MRFSTRAFWLLSLASWLSCGCLEQPGETEQQDPKAPGEVLGFFSLSGSLSQDTCGAESLGAPDEWSFQVKLSRKKEALYWLNGKEGIVGDIDDAGQFSFETRVDTKLAERRGAAKGCTIMRRDSASGAIDEAKGSLSVQLSYAYAQSADSDCSEFIVGILGMPEQLPCAMSYALAGARIDDE